MELSEREHAHASIMRAICEVIEEENKPLVLKGGTALMLCYQIDRFSEDLDFDLSRLKSGFWVVLNFFAGQWFSCLPCRRGVLCTLVVVA